MQKSTSDMAGYIKKIIPAAIPETYPIKDMFKHISEEDNIRSGILAFRDFLYLVCDRLIASGSQYDKPARSSRKSFSHLSLAGSYTFLNNVKSILFTIGYQGILSDTRESILLNGLTPLTSVINMGGVSMKAKIPVPKVMEALRFLAGCGLHFGSTDLDKQPIELSETAVLTISYPRCPSMLTGLKVMAVAQKELHVKGNHDIFLRCDYRVLKKEETEIISVLNDFTTPLPAAIKDFALHLHQRYLDEGLTCKIDIFYLTIRFIYFYKNKEIWTLLSSLESGYRVLVRAQNTHKYQDVIEKFPLSLQEKIAKGFGCNIKRFGEPCQKGCHGFSLPLDNSILDISRHVETWIDQEVSCLIKK